MRKRAETCRGVSRGASGVGLRIFCKSIESTGVVSVLQKTCLTAVGV